MNKLSPCPLCNGTNLEEDWDGLSEGYFDTQSGFLDCQSCSFGIAKVFSTKDTPCEEFTKGLYNLWNSIEISK
jgi:hypothetical protein